MSELVKRFELEVVDVIVNGIAWEGAKKAWAWFQRKKPLSTPHVQHDFHARATDSWGMKVARAVIDQPQGDAMADLMCGACGPRGDDLNCCGRPDRCKHGERICPRCGKPDLLIPHTLAPYSSPTEPAPVVKFIECGLGFLTVITKPEPQD